jgi:hypothetical protein
VTNFAILLETEHRASVANRGSCNIIIIDVVEHKDFIVHRHGLG